MKDWERFRLVAVSARRLISRSLSLLLLRKLRVLMRRKSSFWLDGSSIQGWLRDSR